MRTIKIGSTIMAFISGIVFLSLFVAGIFAIFDQLKTLDLSIINDIYLFSALIFLTLVSGILGLIGIKWGFRTLRMVLDNASFEE